MNKQGSILVEALAAVAIIAVSLTLIMESFATNFRSTVMHQEYAKALVLLENRLDQSFVLDIQDIAKAESFPKPFDRFHYKAKLSGLDPVNAKGLKVIDMTVAWPSGKKERAITASTFLNIGDVKQETKSVFYN